MITASFISYIIKNIPKHDQEYYNSIVNYYVLVGHDHKFKIYNNILATGSVDRTRHGEEEPKGFMELYINAKTKEKKYD